ncbi:MAG TPA: hypothetical protein VL173_07640, partial [Vicinamibacterales bacterium]|nr:hypothetical protein [Vicinamibacterales bacterium]
IDLIDGAWTVTIEMLGFAPVQRQIEIPSDQDAAPTPLVVQSLDDLAKADPPVQSAPGTFPRAPLQFSSKQVETTAKAGRAPTVDLATLIGPDGIGAADGMLINGSLNNGASTPFALPRGIGNNRPRLPTQRSYALGLQLGNSAWDARPFSLTGAETASPSYTDLQLLGTFESQVRLPWLRNPITLTIGYQGSSATTANMQSARVPTDRERAGDFSQTMDARGNPVRVIDPITGQPFALNTIPADRLSPQALALLAYYPQADPSAIGRFNYQAPLIGDTRQDSARARASYRVNSRHVVGVAGAYQRSGANSTSLFGFTDTRSASVLDAQGTWTWTRSRNTTVTARYGFTRNASESAPFFANRLNVSGKAGISGNDQDPRNWGPPTLTFASDVASLTDGRFTSATEHVHALATDMTHTHGLHTFGFGGEFRPRANHTFGQEDPRGTFGFTGTATGIDIADFLLGLPQTSAIAFGSGLKGYRGNMTAAYVTDDWRARSNLTLTYGVRWEYESPVGESHVASGLVRPDRRGLEPRVGFAWRPRLGSSVVVHAGYGIYRTPNVYQPIASLLAIQPPLSTTFNIASTPDVPLTLANGFVPAGAGAAGTFAVDPAFRVPTAHTWDASIQRDFPGSLTTTVSYQGTHGTHLMQMSLPNTYPAGAVNPCPACPSGYRYLTSGGRSNRQAATFEVRRRLSGGFTSTATYTLSRSMDNAAAFGGATLDGAVLMQNWLDPEAEYSRSNFDQRHLLTMSIEHTTGAGMRGGTLIDGWKGRLLKDWTFSGTLSTGSGLPLTPVYFAPVSGTGIIGSLRPDVTDVPNTRTGDGYANPRAFAAPAPGEWGNAKRNSITGPRTLSLNASVARTFRVNARVSFDWRIDATNVLNRVTYASVNMLITSPEFGLPNRVNDMRKVRTSLRVRF